MNDFTKEELKIIAINLCVNEKTLKVLEKLQSMIDNYCKHEKFRELISQDDYIKQCEHCGGILEWS